METWERANAILLQRYKSKPRRARRAVHLFAGIAYCHCGTKMLVPSNNKKYVCTRCHNKTPLNDLEEVFHSQLRDFLLSPEEIAEYLRSADDTIKNKEDLLETLKKGTA